MNGLIFNLYQANKFIKMGATVESIGLSRGKTYAKFKVDNVFNELMERWNNHTLD
ncbi:hypothetical protein [Brassicibacter mesophilus]|uniref:hypothetical protein n=1 Tax=Brassicibacter mesophilus TaxID=745119 RepID=UPI003D1A6830